MKIGVIGTRGFPEIQGGIETHCMELYSRIGLIEGNRITVYRRTPYLNSSNRNPDIRNIRFVDIAVPRSILGPNLDSVATVRGQGGRAGECEVEGVGRGEGIDLHPKSLLVDSELHINDVAQGIGRIA